MESKKRNPRDEAADYIARRDRTEAELRRRLRDKGYSEEEVEETAAFAEECGWIDDASYCRRYIEYSRLRGRGPLRILRDLAEKGVERMLVQELLEELFNREAESAAAFALAEKELSERIDEKNLARTARKLASRGFRAGAISDALRRIRSESCETEEDTI